MPQQPPGMNQQQETGHAASHHLSPSAARASCIRDAQSRGARDNINTTAASRSGQARRTQHNHGTPITGARLGLVSRLQRRYDF